MSNSRNPSRPSSLWQSISGITSTTNTIAILPFIDISSDGENEYFSDGITEQLINALAGVDGMKVTSRTSSFAFKDKNMDIREIGKALGVSTILEGSVRKVKERIRVTTQLINVEDGFQYWSETFDRSLDDVFAVQDEISSCLAKKICNNNELFPDLDQTIKDKQISIQQYKKYLKGKYHVQKINKVSIEKAIAILREVLAKYPEFAEGYLELNKAFVLLGAMGVMPIDEATRLAKSNLGKAISLDPDLAECQRHLAITSFVLDWDFAKAHQHLDKAIELNPNYAGALRTRGLLYCVEQKFAAAHQILDEAFELDPIFGYGHYLKAYVFYCQKDYEGVISYCKNTLAIEPDHLYSHVLLANALTLSGRAAEALVQFEKLSSEHRNDLSVLGSELIARIYQGELDAVTAGIDKLTKALDTKYKGKATMALINIYSVLEEFEKALELVEGGVQQKYPLIAQLHLEPLVENLSKKQRFKTLMSEVLGLEIYKKKLKDKYRKSTFKLKDVNMYHERLMQVMKEEQPYLNSQLTLSQLAASLDIHPNQLSQLLNEKIGKNFSEFINMYRLETFKEKAKDPANRQLTILGIAYDSGFSSKTVFNTFFKRVMGQTPSAYWKQLNE